jgi:hypothetical protein
VSSRDPQAAIWAGLERLLDAAPAGANLVPHRLEPLAARRLRALGRDVPEELLETERLAAVFALTATVHLERARAAVQGPLLLLKGPEVAARYPDPAARISRDLDLLAADAAAAQRALVAAGFVELGDRAYYEGAPHLLPLAWPGLPVQVEVHERPNWPPWVAPPPAGELFAGAVTSAAGVPGLLAPAPARHALVLAAHAWAHGPLERVRDLLDVALLAAEADPEELRRLARAWGVERLWRSTEAIVASLFLGAPPPPALRTWARNLPALRDRTVLEQHLARWLGWYSAFPAPVATRALVREVAADVTPEGDEGWRRKLARTGRALRNAFVRRSEHDATSR